jgi:hypothetical protein
MSKKLDLIKGFKKAVGAKYDSDEDLTDKEKKAIKRAEGDDTVRKNIWKKKGFWDKTKKMMKSAYYGDKKSTK